MIEIIIVAAVIAVGYYFYKKDKKDTKNEVIPESKPDAPTVSSSPLAGRYEARVVAPDANKWGDGTHPNDSKADPAHLGLIYRLGGSFSFTRDAAGHCKGTGELYGNRLRLDFVVPVNGAAVDTFTLIPIDLKVNEQAGAGAQLRLFFAPDGTLTGRCWEHEGGSLNGYDTCYKYGNVQGKKVS